MTACAGQETASTPPGQSVPTSTAPSVPTTAPGEPTAPLDPTQPSGEPERQPARTPPDGAAPVPAAQVDATGLVQDYPTMAWTDDGGKTVGVQGQEGGCGKASAEVTEQSDTQVVITLVETQPPKPAQCTMDIRYPKLTVELAKPLGERKIVLKSEQRTK
ncbi:hypothetical protein [Actinokineospora sp. NBRC 105648]|uniref:hypothetical protein n=1 Tax=Actinokineospora sp. NBRC 105648 TaxID=3032206 RepID=UPI0025566BE3|nr:hypothetical protein [Actinokineospora sp. NBRC 105648]